MLVSPRESRRHLVPLLGALLVAVTLLLLPFAGSLSVRVTRVASRAFAGAPGIQLLSEIPLVLLAVAVAATVGHAWWARSPHRVVATAAAIGVGVGYLASEGLKVAVGQPRPCARWSLAGDCPPAGDWSFPSNHATLAFGSAVVLAVAIRSTRAACAALALAVVVAAGRVLEGSHYLHDVAAGAALGILAVGGIVLLATVVQRGAGAGSSTGATG